ncbi:hypothetical protein [Microvirga antarctica]|uniref:hypothetical protein n=1 Tax=Microvirga antarctica TaxID=2819233 RepID=UPI001B30A8AA|nr:hypothetical protein [Microvirga antarctica]
MSEKNATAGRHWSALLNINMETGWRRSRAGGRLASPVNCDADLVVPVAYGHARDHSAAHGSLKPKKPHECLDPEFEAEAFGKVPLEHGRLTRINAKLARQPFAELSRAEGDFHVSQHSRCH